MYPLSVDSTGGAEHPVRLLDEMASKLSTPGAARWAIPELCRRLRSLRATLTGWDSYCAITCASHPLRTILNEDPFTHRSFARPRGYPGDALLLDFLYHHDDVAPIVQAATDRGAEIYEAMTYASRASQSVRHRRRLLARHIDEVVGTADRSRVLALACGHLREVAISQAVNRAGSCELIAMDQDANSIDVVRRDYAQLPIRSCVATVRQLMADKVDVDALSLAYAAGLYDYLSDSTAQKLTAVLFKRLVRGGRLLIANFTPNIDEAGYMEAFMNWRLMYRTAEELRTVCVASIDPDDIATARTFVDGADCIAYCELTRR